MVNTVHKLHHTQVSFDVENFPLGFGSTKCADATIDNPDAYDAKVFNTEHYWHHGNIVKSKLACSSTNHMGKKYLFPNIFNSISQIILHF